MKSILGNRTFRRCAALGCVAAEVCLHVAGTVFGVHVPHPEGMATYALNYLTVD